MCRVLGAQRSRARVCGLSQCPFVNVVRQRVPLSVNLLLPSLPRGRIDSTGSKAEQTDIITNGPLTCTFAFMGLKSYHTQLFAPGCDLFIVKNHKKACEQPIQTLNILLL